MTRGQSPIGYLKAYMTNLYLFKDSEKVQETIKEGNAAATMFNPDMENQLSDTQLRVAFDGDAVLFSDESEIIVKKHGLDTFFEHKKKFENKPLAQGPLKCFLEALGKLQRKFYAKNKRMNCPICTFLVTARSVASSGARVLKTLRRRCSQGASCRKSRHTSSLTIRCSTSRVPRSWGPSLPMCPMGLAKSITKGS